MSKTVCVKCIHCRWNYWLKVHYTEQIPKESCKAMVYVSIWTNIKIVALSSNVFHIQCTSSLLSVAATKWHQPTNFYKFFNSLTTAHFVQIPHQLLTTIFICLASPDLSNNSNLQTFQQLNNWSFKQVTNSFTLVFILNVHRHVTKQQIRATVCVISCTCASLRIWKLEKPQTLFKVQLL